MSEPPHTASLSKTIQIEFVDAQSNHPDPAYTSAIARDTVASLKREGYVIQALPTGAKGGEIFTVLQQAGQAIYDNKDFLIQLVGLATPIVQHLLKQRDAHLSKPQSSGASAPEITVVIDKLATPISASVMDDESLLAALLAVHPDVSSHITQRSTVTIRVAVPPRGTQPL